MQAVGGDVSLSGVPYLGGTAAVGAIIAVLAVFAPSGLGVREASMYGLLLAVTTPGVALDVIVNHTFDHARRGDPPRVRRGCVELAAPPKWSLRIPASPPALERD